MAAGARKMRRLQARLESLPVIGQAKGVVMGQQRCDPRRRSTPTIADRLPAGRLRYGLSKMKIFRLARLPAVNPKLSAVALILLGNRRGAAA